jgi:hypothetical protein
VRFSRVAAVIDDAALEAARARVSAIESRSADWQAESAIDTSSIDAEREARPVWYVSCGEADDGVPVFVADRVVDRATAEFIAAAPGDVRMLLDIVDSLRRR